MQITAIKSPILAPGSYTLLQLLDEVLTEPPERSVLAVTSKIVSLCEGSVVPLNGIDKQALVRREADRYLAKVDGKWGINFTVKYDTLIPNAGIDESNAAGVHVLWPRDPQATANQVRAYLAERFGLREAGVIITDSTCRPLRRGVSGIALAFSGFKPLNDYRGTPDLFGRPFAVSTADVAGGLAAAAVLVMGEGAESTPLALMSGVEAAVFVPRDPTREELDEIRIALEDDLFAPFLGSAEWLQGDGGQAILER